jgi:FkbM family methyltransferase
MDCQSVADRLNARWCGDAAQLARSYTLQPRWPFDAWHLVMETVPGTCDLYAYRARTFCCRLAGELKEPERHIREFIASSLHDCARRPCRSLDLGANNGWMTAYMLQLGSHVVAVEPAVDFAWAIRETARLNCWESRLQVVNARAWAAKAEMECKTPTNASRCGADGWRYGNRYGVPQLLRRLGPRCLNALGLPANYTVRGVALQELLHQAAGGSGVIDLIKMDADGPEGTWLQELEMLLRGGTLRVDHIVVEGHDLSPNVMRRLQSVHGYTVLRLDEHDGRRWIQPTGWDALSRPLSFERLDRFASEHRVSDALVHHSSPHFRLPNGTKLLPAADNVSRLELEEELLAIRAMRHVFRVKPNMSLQGWVTLLNPMVYHGYSLHWALVRDGAKLLEPTFPSTRMVQQPEFIHHRQRKDSRWESNMN